MGKWSAENSGMSVARSVAKDFVKNEKRKKRIWSDAHEAWGYYMSDAVSDEDDCLLWCLVCIGDRINMHSFGFGKAGEFGTVISVDRMEVNDMLVWSMKILKPNGRMVEMHIKEQQIFKSGWNMISTP